MMKPDRRTIQQAYIRVCRDSGFKMEATQAAALAAGMLRIAPLEIWIAVGDLATMDRIASGELPGPS